MKKKDLLVAGSLIFTIAAFFVGYFYLIKEDKPLRTLPYFEPRENNFTITGKHHSIPSFTFTNQYGKETTQEVTAGKIYVTDYFFTTCQSICPIMSNQLVRVYDAYKTRTDFLILSHTVDPETDTVEQLLNYAKEHGVNDNRWLFLTGSKKDLYALARKGYLLNAEEGNGGEEDFIHTQNFALIDKDKHIRGFYDGTDTLEVSRLIGDLKLLFAEYDYLEKEK